MAPSASASRPRVGRMPAKRQHHIQQRPLRAKRNVRCAASKSSEPTMKVSAGALLEDFAKGRHHAGPRAARLALVGRLSGQLHANKMPSTRNRLARSGRRENGLRKRRQTDRALDRHASGPRSPATARQRKKNGVCAPRAACPQCPRVRCNAFARARAERAAVGARAKSELTLA